jgi:glyoxylase-like metal-dependent hydrolase (beta-lactamase superfamily II)
MHKRKRVLVACSTVVLLIVAAGIASGWFKPTETTVTEVAPGVFFRKVMTEPKFIGCNQGWVIFKDFVLVIDASFPDQADEVIKLIKKTTDKPIRFVFDTHYHGDHADGNQRFAAVGASAVASENSRALFDTKGSCRRKPTRQSTAISTIKSRTSGSRRNSSSTTGPSASS